MAHTSDHTAWDTNLSAMAFATSTTVNRSTGFTPAYLDFGTEISFQLTHTLVPSPLISSDIHYFVNARRKRLTTVITAACEHLHNARLEQTCQYNSHRRDVQYEPGDLVLRLTHPLSNSAKSFSASLAPLWDGPYAISAKLGNLSYRLKDTTTGTLVRRPVHVSKVKHYVSPPS